MDDSDFYDRCYERALYDTWGKLVDEEVAGSEDYMPEIHDLSKLVAFIAKFRIDDFNYLNTFGASFEQRKAERQSSRLAFVNDLFEQVEKLYDWKISKEANAAYERGR